MSENNTAEKKLQYGLTDWEEGSEPTEPSSSQWGHMSRYKHPQANTVAFHGLSLEGQDIMADQAEEKRCCWNVLEMNETYPLYVPLCWGLNAIISSLYCSHSLYSTGERL